MTTELNQADVDARFEALKNLEPISSLSMEQIQELVTLSTFEKLNPGDAVANDNAETQSIYLISGDLEISSGNDGSKQILHGDSDEAHHPLKMKTQNLSAVATSTAEIVRIDKELLDTLLTWGQISAPETEVVMSEDGIMTIDRASWLKSMIRSPTFRKLPPANIEALLNRLEPVKVHGGDMIIRQGDPGDYFYMINEGVALVTRNPDNDEDSVEIAELNEGSSFGEAALISDNPRNATVSMMTDGVLLRLSKEDFNKLLTQPTLQWLSFEDAMARVNKNAIWVDVRLSSEFEHSHLPGAINIPMQSLHKQARELDPKKQYICYCQTGRRSSAATFVLAQYGIKSSVLQNGLENIPSESLVHNSAA